MNTPGQDEQARITALLDAYGADLARWPAAQRPTPAALTEVLGRNAALAAAFADAAALDAALGAIDAPAADDLHAQRLQQRILAALPPQSRANPESPSAAAAHASPSPHGKRTRVPAWLGQTLARRALAALVPLAIGFGAGVSGGSYVDEPASTVMSAGAATASSTRASTDTQYADETTMAPFLLAANVETLAEEMRR